MNHSRLILIHTHTYELILLIKFSSVNADIQTFLLINNDIFATGNYNALNDERVEKKETRKSVVIEWLKEW